MQLEDFSILLGVIVSIISSLSFIYRKVKEFVVFIVDQNYNKLDTRFSEIQENINAVDLQHTKNYLIGVITRVEQGETLTAIERLRFWECYEHYIKMGGNSYIHESVEGLRKKGKI